MTSFEEYNVVLNFIMHWITYSITEVIIGSIMRSIYKKYSIEFIGIS